MMDELFITNEVDGVAQQHKTNFQVFTVGLDIST
jgi:hypothetical protein